MALITDSINFDTRKDLDEIADVLRSTGGQIEKIGEDALAGLGTSPYAIEVLVSGEERKGLFNLPYGYWAVQVYVEERGISRHVELIALGESTMTKIMTGAVLELKFSKKHRDEIAKALS